MGEELQTGWGQEQGELPKDQSLGVSLHGGHESPQGENTFLGM